MDLEPCLVSDALPSIGVAISHPVMRDLVSELLRRDMASVLNADNPSLDGRLPGLLAVSPDLLVIDEVAFTAAFRSGLLPVARTKVIVVGPEPDPAYRESALTQGADAWVARDRLAEELRVQSRRLLGCGPDSVVGARLESEV
ncbi:MAG: hypothetical protein ACRD0O_12300 [Acidimicrobiia bacterium]